jgi:NAD(P)-dependent dehydrogenase (short-subunit alcohol dehydrogenase family)
VIDVDVVGYLLAARAAAQPLIAAAGCVVLTLSDAAFDVRSNNAGIAYLTAKHACAGLVRGLARDLAPSVRVNGVAPSGLPTPLAAADGSHDEHPAIADAARLRNAVASRTLLNRAPELDDLVSTFRFLCGPGAASVTGQILRVDGGLIS